MDCRNKRYRFLLIRYHDQMVSNNSCGWVTGTSKIAKISSWEMGKADFMGRRCGEPDLILM